jgi:hypothetical protein
MKVKASTSYFLNVVDLDDPEWTARDVAKFKKDRPEAEVPFKAGGTKVQQFAAGPSIFNQLLTQMAANHLDISDPTEGRDIQLEKSGKGLSTRYRVTLLIKESAAPKHEGLTNLASIGFTMTDQQQLELLSGSDIPALAEKSVPTIQQYQEDEAPCAALGETTDADDLEAKLRAKIAG